MLYGTRTPWAAQALAQVFWGNFGGTLFFLHKAFFIPSMDLGLQLVSKWAFHFQVHFKVDAIFAREHAKILGIGASSEVHFVFIRTTQHVVHEALRLKFALASCGFSIGAPLPCEEGRATNI